MGQEHTHTRAHIPTHSLSHAVFVSIEQVREEINVALKAERRNTRWRCNHTCAAQALRHHCAEVQTADRNDQMPTLATRDRVNKTELK